MRAKLYDFDYAHARRKADETRKRRQLVNNQRIADNFRRADRLPLDESEDAEDESLSTPRSRGLRLAHSRGAFRSSSSSVSVAVAGVAGIIAIIGMLVVQFWSAIEPHLPHLGIHL